MCRCNVSFSFFLFEATVPTTVVFHFTSVFFLLLFHFHIILSYQKFCWHTVCVPSPEYPLFHQLQYLTACCRVRVADFRTCTRTKKRRKEKREIKKRRGEKMDGARRKKGKGQGEIHVRLVLPLLSVERMRGERRRRNNSKC